MFNSQIPPAESDGERKARHMALLREMAQLGACLARLAARAAIREAEVANAAVPPPETATTRRRDPMLAFAAVTRTVRQCIAQEARLASGPASVDPQERHWPAPRAVLDDADALQAARDDLVSVTTDLAAEADAAPEIAGMLRDTLPSLLAALGIPPVGRNAGIPSVLSAAGPQRPKPRPPAPW